MQSLHFGYGFGSMIAPQFARPYLGTVVNSTVTLQCTNESSPFEYDASLSSSNQSELILLSNCSFDSVITLENSRIQIAYLIAAVAPFLFGIISFAFYCIKPPKGVHLFDKETSFLKVLNPGACAQGNTCFGILMLALLFVFYINIVGAERAAGKFLSSYAREKGLSIDEATNLNTAYWIGFTVGRLSGTIIGIWLKPIFMVTINCISLIIIAAVLSFVGNANTTVLWIFIIAFAWFEAQIFPAGLAWANLYMEMTSMAVCVVIMGAFTGGFIYQRLTGYLFQTVGPDSLMFVLLGSAVCLTLFFAILVIVARRQGQRVFDRVEIPQEDRSEKDAEIATTESTS